MINLHEYQIKNFFLKNNLIIPRGYVFSSIDEIKNFAEKYEKKIWVMKCQIHYGNRGKSGGIKIVNSKKQILDFSKKWLGKRLITSQTGNFGQIVKKILIEEFIEVIQELYVGITIDYNKNCIFFFASRKGGIEIEEISQNQPNLIHRIILNPLSGPKISQGERLAHKIGLVDENQIKNFISTFVQISNLFLEKDLIFLEINPLGITKNNSIVCLDGKLDIDKNAYFRQKEFFSSFKEEIQQDKYENFAKSLGLNNYISLQGNIGCIANGAGLAMGIMDSIIFYGGHPANFLDIGGNATKIDILKAFKVFFLTRELKFC